MGHTLPSGLFVMIDYPKSTDDQLLERAQELHKALREVGLSDPDERKRIHDEIRPVDAELGRLSVII
jgi:hypothetical protein